MSAIPSQNPTPAAQFFKDYFAQMAKGMVSENAEKLEKIVSMVWKANRAGGKVIVAGNGGSAAMASHVTVDFTKCAGIRAVNFNEADLITCLANDYGYEHWIARAIEFYADKNDLIILISSSGKSPNIINGAKQAKTMGLPLVTLSGFAAENPLKKLGDVNLWVESDVYNVVEMVHHIWLLSLVDKVIAEKAAGIGHQREDK